MTPMAAPSAITARPAVVRHPAWLGLAAVAAGRDQAPRWRSAWQRRAAYAALAVLALAAFLENWAGMPAAAVGQFQLTLMLRGHLGLSFAAGQPLVSGLPAVALILVARYPLWSWRLAWLALLLSPMLAYSWWVLGAACSSGSTWDPAQILVVLVAFCVAGVRYRAAVLCWLWALTLTVWWVWTLNLVPAFAWYGWHHSGVWWGALGTVTLTAAGVVAHAVGSRLRAQRALAGQAEETQLERARGAALEGRARIAQEMHDVVARHMSQIARQAEAAQARLAGRNEPVAAEFSALSGAAREAMTDMQRLVGVLLADQPKGSAPQPTLADVPALVAAARGAGVEVELSAPAGLGPVPPMVEMCAYRIVQEALSNARCHAPGAGVRVSVAAQAGALVLCIDNGPGRTPASRSRHLRPVPGEPKPAGQPCGGHGLVGMRERVALLGGSLSAGPAPHGGYEVRAVLPALEPA
jgi:signal transduction histidine kinase